MMGGSGSAHEGIKTLSEIDFTEDLKRINVPTLIMHGDDAFQQAGERRDSQDLSWLAAWNTYDSSRADQC
jgi:hypothetical protein